MFIESTELLDLNVIEGSKKLVRVFIDESVDTEGATRYRYKQLEFSINDSQEYVDKRVSKVKAQLYKELRAAEYPPMEDYMDAVVKGDTEAQQSYIEACLAVKERFPK